jgi:hypothetical protein
MAVLSDELLAFIVKRAKSISFGEVRIVINENAKSKIDVEVIEKARFNVDNEVLPVGKPPRALPAGKDPVEDRRRG